MKREIYIMPDYRWYDKISGDEIQQGDILEDCPVLVLPSKLSFDLSGLPAEPQDIPLNAEMWL